MQNQYGTDAETAISSPERTFRALVLVDWNQDGLFDHPLSDITSYVEEISTDRALEGSAPPEILLIEGSAAAELTVTMSGMYSDTMPLAAIFSPYNTVSPFYNKVMVGGEIKYSLIVDSPYGSFVYQQFVGNVRTITPDRATGGVVITALDRAETMRRPVQLAGYAMSEEHVSYGEVDSQLIRSQWVIDSCARLCGTSVSNKRPVTRQELGLETNSSNGVQVFVTGNGSYVPTVGHLDNPNIQSFPNAGTAMYAQNGPINVNSPAGSPRPLGFAGLGHPIQQAYNTPEHQGMIRYWCADADGVDAPSNHVFGFTVNTNGPNASAVYSIAALNVIEVFIGMARSIQITLQNGQVRTQRLIHSSGGVTVEGSSSFVNLPTGQTSVDIFIHWDMTPTTGSRVYVRAGSNTNGGWQSAGSTFTTGGYTPADQIKGRFTIQQGVNLSDVFYATSAASGYAVDRFDLAYKPATYAAVLDEGLNMLSYLPSGEKQEAWDIVKNVAAAEFGSVFWDEYGVLRFWNYNTLVTKRATVARTMSLDDVEGFTLTNSTDSVRNSWSVSTQKKRAPSALTKIYESSDISEFTVPDRTEARFRMFINGIVSPLTWNMQRYGADGRESTIPVTGLPIWSDKVNAGFVVQYLVSGVWQERDEFPTPQVNVYFTADGYLTIRVINKTGYSIRFANGLASADPTVASARFRIAGTQITDGDRLDIVYENPASIKKYGSKGLALQSDWLQDSVSITNMFDALMPRTADPIPTTDAITVAGDPRIQLGDVVVINDPDGFGEQIKLQILGINRTFGPTAGLTDVYTVEVTPLGSAPVIPGNPEAELVTRYNLCPNPALGRDNNGWYGGSRTASVTGMVRTTGYTGATQVVTPKADVKVGKRYRFSAYVKSGSGTINPYAQIDWYSRWGYMSTTGGTGTTVTNGNVGRVSVNAIAPIGATKGLMVIGDLNTSATVTGVLYEESSTLGTYFDGESTGGDWDGAQYSSTSTVTA